MGEEVLWKGIRVKFLRVKRRSFKDLRFVDWDNYFLGKLRVNKKRLTNRNSNVNGSLSKRINIWINLVNIWRWDVTNY